GRQPLAPHHRWRGGEQSAGSDGSEQPGQRHWLSALVSSGLGGWCRRLDQPGRSTVDAEEPSDPADDHGPAGVLGQRPRHEGHRHPAVLAASGDSMSRLYSRHEVDWIERRLAALPIESMPLVIEHARSIDTYHAIRRMMNSIADLRGV